MPPVVSLIGAVISGITSAVTAAVGSLGGLLGFSSLAGFLASPIGSLVLGLGLQLLLSPLLSRRSQQTPSIEAGKINVRVAEPDRWLFAGNIRSGGGVIFAEFDEDGNFWYLIVHGDSLHKGIHKIYFDDVVITTDGSGNVTTNDFCLDDDMNSYSSGTKITFFQIFTTTYTQANPTPPAIAALAAAFPGANGWTSDHKLVGTTYSVVKVKPVGPQHRYKVYRWRGPLGVGEPAVSLVADWSVAYDPRDGTQTLGNPATYKFTRNAALIWAWFRTQKYGRGKSEASINWTRIAEQADICDQLVLGIDGNNHVRYRCDTAIPESKERVVAEQEILLSCDGQIVFDDDGKSWVRVGYYYTPTLALSRNRDIVAMESVEAQNGESETQGVIVRYLDPDANYVTQPSAAWLNPFYYVEGETPKFLTVDILTCQDHNQAMRLAKAIGMRSQPEHKLLPAVGLRGLIARQERIINLSYDNVFAGDYEIVTSVEVDETGVFCGMGIVPIDSNRWTLTAGEEKAKPVHSNSETDADPSLPENVIISYANGRIEATFDDMRDDWNAEFQNKLSTQSNWSNMAVDMLEHFAYSGAVQQNKTYNVRYRTVSSGGRSSGWVDPVININTTVLALTGTPVTTATAGVAYTGFDIDVSGGTSPYFFVDLFGRLPPGITVNSSTGVVSGTPTTPGTYADIIIRVQDNNDAFNNFPTFTITVS
ncbi:hypothetical protein [Rhizobium phage RHph_X2_24]|nr:hypothetical protein [Rhizobium phage RHph_X2_24]